MTASVEVVVLLSCVVNVLRLHCRMAIVNDQFDKEKSKYTDRISSLESQLQRAEIVIAQLRADVAAAQASSSSIGGRHITPTNAASSVGSNSLAPSRSGRGFVASGGVPTSSGPVGSGSAAAAGVCQCNACPVAMFSSGWVCVSHHWDRVITMTFQLYLIRGFTH